MAVQGRLSEGIDANGLSSEDHKENKNPEGAKRGPFFIPLTWKWQQIGKLAQLINGDRSKNYPNRSEYVSDGVPWINTGHIEPDGTLSLTSMNYISEEKFESLRSGKVKPNDILYCLRGATLGKTAIVTQFDRGAVASSLVIIRFEEHVDPRFAYCVLTSPLGRSQIFEYDNGSAQPNLSANSVKKYWFPLPPLAEQRRIVAKVDELMALVDRLDEHQRQAHDLGGRLLTAAIAELTQPRAEAA
ncbi:restriction endonuclease subunit S [Botrimarina sp.]|uniref:restriction endonuclease subunit S n=1 Tax=Botrimarina sp. TaxID=2795802 RepID=UPI0032EB428A